MAGTFAALVLESPGPDFNQNNNKNKNEDHDLYCISAT